MARPLRLLLPLDGSSDAETILAAVLPLADRRPPLAAIQARFPGRATPPERRPAAWQPHAPGTCLFDGNIHRL